MLIRIIFTIKRYYYYYFFLIMCEDQPFNIILGL